MPSHRKLVQLSLSAMVLALSGCFIFTNYNAKERLTVSAREFNDDVRWSRFEQAAAKIPADKRQQFIDKHRALEDELEIADYELAGVDVDKSDKKMTRATARVELTWTLKRRGLLEKTIIQQSWEDRDGGWVVVKQERMRGSPLTLYDESTRSASARPAPQPTPQ